MRRLQHDRPFVVFDLETTGVSPREDRIVEISIIKFSPGARDPEVKTRRLNPERSIPSEASAVHGIRDADVADEPTFRQVARSLAELLEGCDLAGYNVLKFDLPMLVEEFNRADVEFPLEGRRFLDVQRMFHKLEPRDLSAAVQRYLDEEHTGAHGAEADAHATFRVLEAMLRTHPTLPRDVESLQNEFNPNAPSRVDAEGKLIRKDGVVVMRFGKHRDEPLARVAQEHPDYLEWILQGDFSLDVKRHISRALQEARRG